jgi:uncharacterized membrane protein YhaH (DUF805 family)
MNEINNSDNLDYSAPPRSFIEAIKVCFAKYAVFKGRASRSEFWWFHITKSLCLAVLSLGTGLGLGILLLATLVPYCAVGVRRFHDTNLSGAGFVILFTVISLFEIALEIGFGDDATLRTLMVVCIITLLCLCTIRGKKEKNEYNLPTDLGREITS